MPAFTYTSVPFHGPKMAPNFGTHQAVRAIAGIQRVVRGHRELVAVGAKAKRRAKRSRPLDLALRIDRRHRLADFVLARRRQPLAVFRAIETDRVEPITPHLHADGALGVPLEEMTQPPVRDSAAGGDAALGLLELIAVLRVIEEVGEIREQVQAVVQQEAGRTQRRGTIRMLILGGEALAVRLPAVTRIDETEPAESAPR